MGVPGLWDVLRPAGKMRSLTHLSVKDGFEANPDGKRGFRVGIDASIWFYHATYGREGENPELRTLFFRCTRLMGMPFLPLFVFDGPKRPEIKRGKRISGKNHWMVQGMQEIISAFGFEWRMAPGEAEAELAYLNRIGVIDAVLSDDVDTFLFGAKLVVRNPSATLSGNRTNPMKNAAGKDDGNHVMTYAAADLRAHPDIQLTQGGLVLVGVLRGGDYSDGLHGCGVLTAHGLARAGFGDALLDAARTLPRDALAAFLARWREDVRVELRTNARGCLPRKCAALARAVPEDFPSVDVVLAYARPVTSEAKGAAHRNANVAWDRDPDLGRIAGLCEMYFEWGVREIIVKRFRTVLWPAAVLRILRRAAILRDGEAGAGRGAGALGERGEEGEEPGTPPRKGGSGRGALPGTPSSVIAKHFSTMALGGPSRGAGRTQDSDGEEEEEGERLIVKIHSAREHPSTDRIREYRLEVAPAQLVRLCEAGVRGLRTALPPDLSDDDEEEEVDDDDEGGGKRKDRRGKKAPPDPESHLRMWLPACMVEMVEPEMVDEFEGVQRWKAEKKAGKGGKAAGQGKEAATVAKKTKAGAELAAAVAEEEEEDSAEEEEPPTAPKARATKAKAKAGASAEAVPKNSRSKTSSSVEAGKRAGPPKIDNFFKAKKPTKTAAAGKPAKTTTSRVADLFKALSSDSDGNEERSVPRRPRPPSQKSPSTRLAAQPPSSQVSARSGSSSSRILSLLDSQPLSSPSPAPSPPKATASSPPKARALQPFPMDFDAYPLNTPPTADEDPFTPGAGPSSLPTSRARARSSLSTSESDSHSPSASAAHKSPRKSEKHSSPRSTPHKDGRPQRTALRREEDEESSDSDFERRPPSPSPLKGRLATALGSGRRALARREEEEESDGASSRSLVRPRKLVTAPASSRLVARSIAVRKPVRPLPADLTIISISSDSESDPPPPKLTARAAAPLQIAKARLNTESAGGKPARRAYDPDDVIDLT